MRHSAYQGWLLLALVAGLLALASCSTDRDGDDGNGGLGPHPDGWMAQTSGNFHGWPALVDSAAGCRGCHGQTLQGGDDGNSCFECHAYLHTQVTRTRPETHQALVAFDDEWHIQNCAVCHGDVFDGGPAGVSCLGCHEGGPDECGVCHSMPPTRTSKVPFGMQPEAAGAHEVHARFACRECHPAPGGLAHVGPLPAEVSFERALIADTLVANPAAEHIGAPTSGNAACSNVYCHSDGYAVDGRVGPPVAMPQWVPGGLGCGGCHRLPPPADHHPQVTTCGQCHHNVDPATDDGNPAGVQFLDDSTHVNGQVNF